MLTVSVALDRRGGLAAGPTVRALGLPDDGGLADDLEGLEAEAERAVLRLSDVERDDPNAVEAALARTLKKAAFRIWKRRPVVEATVLEVR
jgi:ribonuclease J